jgi:adenosylmethionine-8-amino-7-oxononanoate aminotransferase
MLGVELRGLSSVEVVTAALARDVWVYPAGSGAPVADAVLIAPPFVIEDHHVDRIVSVLAASINDVQCRGR